MKLNQIVPGVDYKNGDLVRRVIRLDGVLRISHHDMDGFFEDDHIIKIRKGIEEGVYGGSPAKGAYRDLTSASAVYLEGDLSTAQSMSIPEFAEWADTRRE